VQDQGPAWSPAARTGPGYRARVLSRPARAVPRHRPETARKVCRLPAQVSLLRTRGRSRRPEGGPASGCRLRSPRGSSGASERAQRQPGPLTCDRPAVYQAPAPTNLPLGTSPRSHHAPHQRSSAMRSSSSASRCRSPGAEHPAAIQRGPQRHRGGARPRLRDHRLAGDRRHHRLARRRRQPGVAAVLRLREQRQHRARAHRVQQGDRPRPR
jgi:hypothetical protein